MQELVWKIGGEQGQGLDSTNEIFATVCNRQGYYVYAYKTFASRIKGGHTNFTVRVSTKRVLAPAEGVNVLVAMDQETIDKNIGDLLPGGLLLADANFNPVAPAGVSMIALPMTEIARQLLDPRYKNMVALGASCALLGMDLQGFKDYVQFKWGKKGGDVVAGNTNALMQGYDLAKAQAGSAGFSLDAGDGKTRMFLTGNDAVALGAVAAGCRVAAAYPITPATEIIENAAKYLPKFGGVAVQMEDELAAVGVAIGAGFAGARALTSTSGPGISLKQEYLGLAAMAEIPVVVVDTQRGGPSTGMPTKQEQSDLLALTYGGHGEAPRIVLAPGTGEQAFSDTVLAFNLADNYHCPVMIASDLALALWLQTVEPEDFDVEKVEIDRGPLPNVEELQQLGRDVFKRYAKTESGVSPRSLPGMPNGQFLATGAEHGPFGKVTEDAANRKYMMDRRLNRIKNLQFQGKPVELLVHEGPEDADILLIGYGSPYGAVAEAATYLREEGRKVATIQVRVINPFPTEAIQQYASKAGKTFVVEQNATGQLAFIARGHGVTANLESILKYDGTLFRPAEIADLVRKAL